MKRVAIIMAGGSGERFWPLSRAKRPKQLLNLNSQTQTMIEESIARIAPLINIEDIYIITSSLLLEPVRNALPNLPPENVIAEAAKRNTAPCLALAAAFIKEKYSSVGCPANQISIAVLTADQRIEPAELFVETVDNVMNYVENHKVLATIGIIPSRPETGYGYIQVENKFEESPKPEIQAVVKFLEKPDLSKAIEFVATGNFLWNSGMFFWRLDTFIEGMIENIPEIGNKIADFSNLYKGKTELELPDFLHTTKDLYESLPNISIDYALMEKAKNVVVAKALFNWDDIGSFDSLERVHQLDENGNISIGINSILETNNSIIFNSTANKSVVATLGLDDIVVIVSDDAVMVCQKNRVQEIKKNVEDLRKKGLNNWL